MLHYVTFGTNDLARSIRFYDPVMLALGFHRHVTVPEEAGYGPPLPEGHVAGMTAPNVRTCFFWITQPYMKLPASWGNGTMLALAASSRAAVDAFHAAAVSNGGFDEGAPGIRSFHPSFYACYVRDPDGNKLSAVCEH
jgi:catechol 2,3-dioxygenase-like lactoylglutathione lyase family enzyme